MDHCQKYKNFLLYSSPHEKQLLYQYIIDRHVKYPIIVMIHNIINVIIIFIDDPKSWI